MLEVYIIYIYIEENLLLGILKLINFKLPKKKKTIKKECQQNHIQDKPGPCDGRFASQRLKSIVLLLDLLGFVVPPLPPLYAPAWWQRTWTHGKCWEAGWPWHVHGWSISLDRMAEVDIRIHLSCDSASSTWPWDTLLLESQKDVQSWNDQSWVRDPAEKSGS